jgi:hypothetical protein
MPTATIEALEISLALNLPRPSRDVDALILITEVSERAVYAMYDMMRGAQTGAQKTVAGRKAR